MAPFVMVGFLIVAWDEKLMQGQPSSRLGWIVVAVTTIAMFAAGIAMFVVEGAGLSCLWSFACPSC
jgi:hypothetical protein